jgi:predicted DNA-binding transcriptional regulator AlpA
MRMHDRSSGVVEDRRADGGGDEAMNGWPARLWTVHDVSAFLAVPVGTLYQWRVRGEGPPAMRLGRHLRFEPSEVRRWADSHHGAA